MGLRNYLPQLSERFPDLYLMMNDRLLDCIQNAYEEIKEQIGIKEFAKSIRRSTSGLREVIDGKKSPSLGLIAELSRYHRRYSMRSTSMFKNYGLKHFFVPVRIPKELTKDYAYVLGAFRDGSITKHKYEIEFGQKYKSWIVNSVIPRFKKVFGIELHFKMKRGNVYLYRVSSKPAYAILELHGRLSEPCAPTPPILEGAPFDMIKSYIAGFYDAEGAKGEKLTKVGIYQSWYVREECPPLEFIAMKLREQGINCGVRYLSKGVNFHKFWLTVYRRPKGNQKRFFQLIPVEHPKLERFKKFHLADV